MKVAFYLKSKSFRDVSISNLEDGNPGIGGSEYACLLVVKELNESSSIRSTIYFDKRAKLTGFSCEYAVSLQQALSHARNCTLDYFVVNYADLANVDFSNLNSGNSPQLIIWCHNFISLEDAKLFAESSIVSYVICVGREQKDLLIDHKLSKKLCYIYNPIPKLKPICLGAKYRRNSVCYIGSIIPEKGLHILTSCWKNIVREVPDAELHVIGSGDLYGDNVTLGPFNIAECRYERLLLEPVMENGLLMKGVHFHGILGKEKNEILNFSKVGCPNPSGKTETFGYTAVEMQLNGCYVITSKCPGYLDTVDIEGGALLSSKKLLSSEIVRALRTKKSVSNEVANRLLNKFSISMIVKDWEELFVNGSLYIEKQRLEPLVNSEYKSKWMKFKLAQLKRRIPFLNVIPSVLEFRYFLFRAISVFGLRR